MMHLNKKFVEKGHEKIKSWILSIIARQAGFNMCSTAPNISFIYILLL